LFGLGIATEVEQAPICRTSLSGWGPDQVAVAEAECDEAMSQESDIGN
jgi:shikimate kinase